MQPNATAVEYSDFDQWEARDYLTEYYGSVMEDERHAMQFLVDSVRGLPPVARAIDVGSGPCVHHCFPLARCAREIHCADYVPGNRVEIQRWLDGTTGAHDWRAFSLETLRLQGEEATPAAAARLEAETRARLTRVMPADIRAADPVGRELRGGYALVTSHYCAEAISTDKDVFRANMRNLASLVAPGGMLVTSACGAANFYKVGARHFPCSGVTPEDVLSAVLALGFRDVDVRVRSTPTHTEQGYASVVFARAIKPGG